MELSKFNQAEIEMIKQHNNLSLLKDTLEKNIEFYRNNGQFDKLEKAQMFLLKLYDEK